MSTEIKSAEEPTALTQCHAAVKPAIGGEVVSAYSAHTQRGLYIFMYHPYNQATIPSVGSLAATRAHVTHARALTAFDWRRGTLSADQCHSNRFPPGEIGVAMVTELSRDGCRGMGGGGGGSK